ncbi:MAG: DUF4424 domain-containing protein [Bacteroidales bacterium]|nr:DUF4424 domain-containing protein [Bacteroidales bacterium]MCM1147201.1 DUF4424 domain-containing protein [Bacteroidales bacterium]MCM1205427.1 DUF4424 domain-containing protein [Bacillota bacterium]MCM1509768.1 DUF4424 domain-containing protein [Clostridium sp.]
MKRRIMTMLLAVLAMAGGYANDGVFFTNGSFLVPVTETDIAVSKEILTITVGQDGFARVDVYYEFLNRGGEKTVTMAFEAASPYNTMEPLRREGGHPYVDDFTVTMNERPLEYTTGIVAVSWADGVHTTDFVPLDTSKWKGVGEVDEDIVPYDDAIYNPELDSLTAFSYAYYFPACFLPGKNVVHHTYRYRMSYNVACKFEIPYRLTPATRWANGQVDDFTLRIKTDVPADICLADSLFSCAPFAVTEGRGSIYSLNMDYMGHFLLAALAGNSVMEWHSRDFSPKTDMCIMSADFLLPDSRWATSSEVVVLPDGSVCRYVGDCGDRYLVMVHDYKEVPKDGALLMEYSASKAQGFLYATGPGTVNVHRIPSEESAKVGIIKTVEGDMPDTFPCLGLDKGWYKLSINDRVGYVREDLMRWSPVPTR